MAEGEEPDDRHLSAAMVSLRESLRMIAASRETIERLRGEAPDLAGALETLMGVVTFHSKQIARLEERAWGSDTQEGSPQREAGANEQSSGRLVATTHVTPSRAYRSWGEMKGAAALIVLGRAGRQVATASKGGEPSTLATEVQVERELLGRRVPPLLRVVRYGGMVGGVETRVVGYPRLIPGDRYLLFLLPPQEDGAYFTVGVYQGVFTVRDGLVNSISPEAAQLGVPVHNEPLDRLIEAIEAAPAIPAPEPR